MSYPKIFGEPKDDGKTIEQIDKEVDEFLSTLEMEHIYRTVHDPETKRQIDEFKKEFSKEEREDMWRRNHPGQRMPIDEIKSLPILDLMGKYGIKLSSYSAGRKNCKCPFHNDKFPSMVVYLNTNSWYCFGCNKGGSVIDFVMNKEKCDCREAIKIIQGLWM